ncbi:hypothetical protein J3459_017205 [Metarhizium acridum]|nr:hypothetical protein J3459_017205 [Metarhizium acridum]
MLVICEPPSPDGREKKSRTCKRAETYPPWEFSYMPYFHVPLLNHLPLPKAFPDHSSPGCMNGARDTSRLGNHTAARHIALAKYHLREPIYALPSELTGLYIKGYYQTRDS